MNFPQQAWCPTCGQEGMVVTEETDVARQRVARGISHLAYAFPLRRGGAKRERRHHHQAYWGYVEMACSAGHSFVSPQLVSLPCWCGWPQVSSADRRE